MNDQNLETRPLIKEFQPCSDIQRSAVIAEKETVDTVNDEPALGKDAPRNLDASGKTACVKRPPPLLARENQVHRSSTLPGIVFLILGPRLTVSPAALFWGAGNGAVDYGHGAGDYGHGAVDYGHGAGDYRHGAGDYGHGAGMNQTEKGQTRHPASAHNPGCQLLVYPAPASVEQQGAPSEAIDYVPNIIFTSSCR
ncbi:hypothetical protein llap_9910 [Limosa lapponica baueri]|uniref:Uncharacterized protein n=1 Tax=Limosa lapponica baueri TaxID=1758121 RepID=A0A2I0U123_LIMLA|nr:hypothetical protein llap_9910 [Limosa lapponica baueri]